MTQKSPTKLVNTRISCCCCKRLSSNDRLISHFGETETPKILEFRKLIIPELRVWALTKRNEGSGDDIDASSVGPLSGVCVFKYDFQTTWPRSTIRILRQSLHKTVERHAFLTHSCFVTQTNKKTEGGLGRREKDFCDRRVANFPLHQQREIRIGPLTMHRGQIFWTSELLLVRLCFDFPGKSYHDMAVDMAVYGGRFRSFIPSNRKH